MRTYAPAPTRAVLDQLLEEPSLARGVLHHEVIPAREATHGAVARLAGPPDPGAGSQAAASSAPYSHQAEAIEAVHARPGHRRRHADRVGQVAVLHAAGPPGARRGPVGARAVPVPHQGARPGPGRGVRRARRSDAGSQVAADDVRRRHAGPDPLGDPQGGPGRGHQPGHAPLGDPAPPHEVVPAVRAAPGHRHRRAAHVPRRVRQPRRQRPPAAAPAVRATTARTRSSCAARRRSGTRPSSRSSSPGRPVRLDRPQRRAVGREARPARRPAGLDPATGARGSALTLAQRWALPFLRAGRQTIVFGRAPGRGRDHADSDLREALREDLGPRSRIRGYRGGYLPTERRAIERGLRDGEVLGVVAHERARARRRHRRASTSSVLAGYPGSIAGDVAADRAGPAAGGESSVAILVASGSPVDQYVIHHPEFLLERPAGGGAARPGQPPRAARPPPLRDVRAAVRARRRVRPRAGRRPARVPRARRARPAGGRRALVLELGELPGLGGQPADGGARERRDHRHDAGPAAGHRRDRPVRGQVLVHSRRSTCTTACSTTSTSSTGASARPTSTRSTSTTTRTPTGP